jgi:hypothetical protein
LKLKEGSRAERSGRRRAVSAGFAKAFKGPEENLGFRRRQNVFF